MEYIYHNAQVPTVHICKNGTALCSHQFKAKKNTTITTIMPFKSVSCINCLTIQKKGKTKRQRKQDAIAKHKNNKDSFYMSWEWKKVRYNILLKYGRKCMCCGATPSDTIIIVDHIKPRKKFPELALDENNLQVLCNDCNMGKSNDDYTDFR